MRKKKRQKIVGLLFAVALLVPVGLVVSQAGAGAAPVVETGSITCTFAGSVTYTPHLLKGGKGSATSSVNVNHASCTTPAGKPLLRAQVESAALGPSVVRPYTFSCPTSTTYNPRYFCFENLPPDKNTMGTIDCPDVSISLVTSGTVCTPPPLKPQGFPGAPPTRDCDGNNRDAVDIGLVINWNGISINKGTPNKTKIAPTMVIFGGAQPDWSTGLLTYHIPVPGPGGKVGYAHVTGSFAGSNHGAGSFITIKTSLSQAQYAKACATTSGFAGMNFTGTMTLQSTTRPPTTTTTMPAATTKTTSQPGSPSIVLGQSNSDTATVTSSAPFSTSSLFGPLSFYLCGPDLTPTSCTSTTPGVQSLGASDSNGNGADTFGFGVSDITPSSTGDWCFASYYAGNSTHAASSDTSTDECFNVTAPVTTTMRPTTTTGGIQG